MISDEVSDDEAFRQGRGRWAQAFLLKGGRPLDDLGLKLSNNIIFADFDK